MFRIPITTEAENERFYNLDYEQGFTTEMPSDQDLAGLLETNFAGTDREFSAYVKALNSLPLPEGAKIFDYG